MASRVTLKVPFRLTLTTFCHSSGENWYTEAVEPEMPALLTNTSKPPRAFTARRNRTANLMRLGDVANGHDQTVDLHCERLERIRIDVADGDPGSICGERQRNFTADARGPAVTSTR
jgi:hypothetical protein